KIDNKTPVNSKLCGDPSGVTLDKWLPAVECWLKEMLPPKIAITKSACGINDDWFNGKSSITLDQYINSDIEKLEANIFSNSQKYYYNKIGNIDIELTYEGKNYIYDNYSKANISIKEIFDIDKNEKIYDKNSSNNILDIRDYIQFNDLVIPFSSGRTSANFTTKQKDTKIVFEVEIEVKNSSLETKRIIKKDLILEVRGDLMFLNSYAFDGEKLNSSTNIIKASNRDNVYLFSKDIFNSKESNYFQNLSNSEEKLLFSLDKRDKNGNIKNLDFPLDIKIIDSQKNEIFTQNNISSLNEIKLGIFKKSGKYNISIIDKTGFEAKSQFEILPDTPSEIEVKLGTKLMEKSGVTTTNLVNIFDQYKNPSVGEILTVDVKILGDKVVLFDDNKDNLTLNFIEGFRMFNLTSQNKIGTAKIQFDLKSGGEVVKTITEEIKVVDKLDFEITGEFDDVKVGNNTYNYEIKIKDDFGYEFNGV
ncbi:MAG: hypothetical protein NWP80_00055, partial [Candidatus Gracilibacteria bacterium]|nr:hypothetical protein [Candidatus Gracilibacteria bacterium]